MNKGLHWEITTDKIIRYEEDLPETPNVEDDREAIDIISFELFPVVLKG